MAVFKLVVSYRGTGFCGWQRQKAGRTLSLQEILEKALSLILCERTRIIASGRTDAGVHSLGQVAAFRTEVHRSPERLLPGLNSFLPESIRILSVQRVPDDFHPQFRVKEKAYRYLIQNGAVANPLLLPYTYFFPKKLNLRRMQEAADFLVGRHNFAAFQDSGRKAKDSVRTIYRLTVEEVSDSLFFTESLVGITISGDGFLYKMVRNIVGTLIEVGRKKIEPQDVKKILESGDRRQAGPTVPACGLTLMRVRY